MGRGRKSLPAEVKVLRGTAQPCRTVGSSGGFSLLEKVPSSGLKGIEKKIFVTAAQEMIACQVLETVGVPQLIAYAKEMGLYFSLTKEMEDADKDSNDGYIVEEVTKNGFVRKVNPKRKIAQQALSNAKALASEFGFTPASRSKIAAMLAGAMPESSDDFAEFEDVE